MIFKRLLVISLVVSMSAGSLLPTLAQAANVNMNNSKGVLSVSSTSSNLPETDWSAVDWDQEVVLPQDLSNYQKKAAEFAGHRDSEALRNLAMPKHKMGDADVMTKNNVPKDVQEMVRQYREVVDGLSKTTDQNRIKMEKDFLSNSISELHPSTKLNKTTDSNLDNVVDVRKAPKIYPKRIIPYKPTETQIKVEIKNRFTEKQSSIDLHQVSARGIREQADSIQETLKKRNGRQANIGDYLRTLLGVESASAGTPIIANYTGIEKYPTDNALYYLSTQQNVDGSFGSSNQYENTAEIVFTLSDFKLTNNDQFTTAVNFLKNTAPTNIREKAIKVRMLIGLGQPYQALLDEIIAQKNKDGGYGLQPRYASDVETSAQVAWAMWAGNYSISDALPKVLLFITSSIPADGAMRYTANSNPSYYLINFTAQYLYPFKALTLAADGGFAVSIQSKINSLLNYLNSQYDVTNEKLLGAENTMDESATASTWKIYQVNLDKATILNKNILSRQAADGSFDQSIKSTLWSLKALARGDLVLTDLVSVGSLINKSQAQFALTIKNRGLAPISTSTVYLFADGYNTGIKFDLKNQGIIIQPNETIILNISIPDTIGYFGDVEMRMYIEDDGDLNYDDNWITKTFTFASAADGSPALQMYFMAGKHVIGGVPNLNVRWGKVKSDVNRMNYVIMWRQKGTVDWNYQGINTTWNGAFLGGAFADGVVYEVTAGVVHNNGNTVTYFSNLIDVKTGSIDTDYLGGVSGSVTLDNSPLGAIGLSGYSVNGKADDSGKFAISSVPNGASLSMVQAYQYDGLYSRFPVSINATTTNVRLFSHLKFDNVTPTISNTELRWASTYKVKNQQEYQLLTWGSDNVSLKDGDFYLWNPTQQIWIYLGSASASNAGSNYVEMKWSVPTDLPLGTGYKIKGNLRDYRGNESGFKEWGPFEIIDGTPPNFNIISPNGGEQFVLGTTNTIKWSTTSTGGVSKVNLYTYYPNYYTSFGSSVNNTGSYDWKLPLSSNYVGDKIKIEVKGNDNKNFLSGSDQSDNYFTVKDPSPKPADPWSMPNYLFDSIITTSSGPTRDNLQVEYDTSGVGHLVYRYVEDSIFTNPRIVTEKLMYSKYQNSAWSDPIEIYKKVWTTDANMTGYRPIYNLKLKLQGLNPQLIWQTSGGSGGCTSFNDQEIFNQYFDGTKWVGPVNLSNNNTQSSDPDMAIDAAGNIFAIWTDGTTWDDACKVTGTRSVNFVNKPIGGNWTVATQLSLEQYSNYPRLATTNDGKLRLIYIDNKTIKQVVRSGSSWSVPTTVLVVSGSIDYPNLKSVGNNLYYAYQEYYDDPVLGKGRSRIMYTSLVGNVWTPVSEVSDILDNVWFRSPQIVVVGSQPQIIFEHDNNTTGINKLVWTTLLSNNSWFKAQNINLDSQYISDGRFAIAGSGKSVMAVWSTNYSYSSQIAYNTADLNIDYTWPDNVLGVQATSSKNTIIISWAPYQDKYNDFDHFNVYRSFVASTSTIGLQPLASINNTSTIVYNDVSTQINQQYYYAITAVDNSGHESVSGNFVGPVGIYTTLNTTITATPPTGIPPLPVKLLANPSGGSASSFVTKLDFSQLNLRNIVPAFATGSGESQDNGDTLYLNKMMWKAVSVPYTITPNTIVELDFKSNGLGWSHGFGFDNGFPEWNTKHFIAFSAVYGDSPTTDNSFKDYTIFGQWKHYKVPVGQLLFNKAYSEMFFASYCGNSSCPAVFDSYFRNVRVYESDKPNYSYAWDFGDGTTATSSVGLDSVYHTYNSIGDFTAKVTVSDGQTQVTKTILIKTAWSLLGVTLTATPDAGISPLPVKLFANSSGGAASKVPVKLDFSQLNLRNIVPAFATGSGESQDNGDTLYLNKMMWKAVSVPYTITPNTIVELDFKSNGLGWSHGFGFDNGFPEWNTKHFIAFSAVYGDSPTTDNSFKDYTIFGQWKHYKVPVGQLLFNKAYSEMFFASYCGNSSCPAVFDSYFRNVRVYESDKPNYSYAWNFGDGTTATSSAGLDSVYHTYASSSDYVVQVTVSDGQNVVNKTTTVSVTQ